MISVFIALMGIVIGVIGDRVYITNYIKKDIELNRRVEYRTSLNDEYTDKKVYCLNYFLREFLGYND